MKNDSSDKKIAFYGFRKAFIKNVGVPVHARLLLILLMTYKGKNEFCWVSQGLLANIMLCHRDSVRKYLRILQKKGYLKAKQRGIGRSLLYAPSYTPIYAGLNGRTLPPNEKGRQRPNDFHRALSINSGNIVKEVKNV